MKTIWMILIGMVLFNGFILLFNGFFPQSPYSTPEGQKSFTNITEDANFSSLKGPSFNFVADLLNNGLTVGFLISGLLVTLYTRDIKYLAACGLCGLTIFIWNQTGHSFSNIMYSFPIVGGIYTIISIAVGICVALLIFGIFTSQEQLT